MDTHRKGYRYEEIAEALARARLSRAGPLTPGDAGAPVQRIHFALTQADRALMISLAIEFDGTAFQLAGFNYERLADAVTDARRSSLG